MQMIADAIQVKNLGKCFRIYPNRWHKLQGLLLNRRDHSRELWAVRNLNFSLPKGSTMAVIGANGSGKTTLLQILAGLIKPTEGSVHVNGNMATILELGSGFNQELTGRENIFISGGLRGFSRREVEEKIHDIVCFAELEDFIDDPIKHYSSGMIMRLAFATAINVEPDVLLIDEVFAVGDMAFQHKCTGKFRELKRKGITTVLVTHDVIAAKSFGTDALLLDHGSQVLFGNPEEVTNKYLELTAQKIAKQEAAAGIQQEIAGEFEPAEVEFLADLPETTGMFRHGSGAGKFRAIQILNSKMQPTAIVAFGEEITFRFFIEYFADVPVSGLGFYIRDRYGNDVIGINTFEEERSLGSRHKGDRLVIDFRLPLHLRAGSYSVSPGFSYHPNEARYLDWIDNAAFFEMEKPSNGKEIYGFSWIPNRVSVKMVS